MLRQRNRGEPAHGRPAHLVWDYDRAEVIADGVIHAAGLAFAAIGAVVLALVTARSARLESASVGVYLAGLFAMLGCSAAYNLWPISRAKWILRRFDHSAIYVMIAGTYTPFLAQMKSSAASIGLLVAMWVTVGVAVGVKLLWPGRLDRLSILFYMLLSWSGVLVYDAVMTTLPSASLWLLLAGGALYTFGVIFHVWQRLRFQNAIWHAFVLAAAICHYAAVVVSVG